MSSNLRIDTERLWSTLMETAAFGATAKGGINRQTLTAEDAQVRTWFKQEAEKLGCTVTVDEVGNMFAVRPGRNSKLAPIALGSHLDTQPSGGKFDGVLGVLGGLEVMRTLVSTGYETNAPIMVINWTNEEGARFPCSMLGSAVFAGVTSQVDAEAVKDPDGVRFGEALEAIGWRGTAPVGRIALSAYLELHIEQGPILEAENKTIGVVTGVQGLRWFELRVTGRDSHAGTTLMPRRADALAACALLITRVKDIALARGPTAVATVGRLLVTPNSPNVIPGEVYLTIDMRDPNNAVLDSMEAAVNEAIADVIRTDGVAVTIAKIADSPAVTFDPECVAAVRAAATDLGFSHRNIISGASHDAVSASRVTRAGMIFVPCKDGLSHNEAESATIEHCGAGTQVLLESALALDAKFGEG